MVGRNKKKKNKLLKMINNKHYFNIFIYLFLIISKTLSHIEPRNNETVKSNIDTTYGSIEIEYVKKKKKIISN